MNYDEIRKFDLSERERFLEEYFSLWAIRNQFLKGEIIRSDDYPAIARITRQSLSSAINAFLQKNPKAQSIYFCDLWTFNVERFLYNEILNRSMIILIPLFCRR